MKEKYPFSPGTPEAESLEAIQGKDRVAILQATHVYKDACEEALTRNHPRLEAFNNWLESSYENKIWYIQYQDKIKLVEDGIEILGDVFCLENETAEENGVDIWNHEGDSYFTFNATQRHAAEQGKRIPSDEDWTKYLEFLPGSEANRFSFFTEVLGIKPAGTRNTDGVTFYGRGYDTDLWSSTPSAGNAYSRNLNWYRSTVLRGSNSQAYGFSVRCLKD